MKELYTLTKNGKPYRIQLYDQFTRPAAMVKLERERSKAVIGGLTYTWKGDNNGAVMAISNGVTWKLERVK